MSEVLVPMANAVVRDEVMCQIFLKKGHIVISCFNCHNENHFPTMVEKRPHYHPRSGYAGNKPVNSTNAVWYPDFGPTDHVTTNAVNIQKIDSSPSTLGILTANGNHVPPKHSGYSSFSVGGNVVKLDKILHVPDVKKNLISIKRMCCDNDLSIIFYSNSIFLLEGMKHG